MRNILIFRELRINMPIFRGLHEMAFRKLLIFSGFYICKSKIIFC